MLALFDRGLRDGLSDGRAKKEKNGSVKAISSSKYPLSLDVRSKREKKKRKKRIFPRRWSKVWGVVIVDRKHGELCIGLAW